jgi:hypothetical protein
MNYSNELYKLDRDTTHEYDYFLAVSVIHTCTAFHRIIYKFKMKNE